MQDGGWSMAGCVVGLLVLGVAALGARAGVVYTNDFEKGAGPEWSNEQVEATPKGERRFLGPFSTDQVALRLGKLPKHEWVRVSFDLYVMGTWDGNATVGRDGAVVGPDVWRMSVSEKEVDGEKEQGEP